MGTVRTEITDAVARFCGVQPIFFVATAPIDGDGLVNCSPKGNRDEFAIISSHEVAYLDRTGSGIETVAHLRENGRIVVMFCAFDGPARIVRFHGTGSVVLPGEARFDELRAAIGTDDDTGARSIVVVSVTRVSDSCGYAVPEMEFVRHRTKLEEWATKQGPERLHDYQARKNRTSIDGLPGIDE